ncbi:hypothetical protein QQZ08_006610 [Neonectria magnoliae]|uniref:Uncharacterized protein n=1 Tax=Neonectria magnoliae TaxID=2732573 RepID=A0ABR1I049_9HYPO
MASPAHTHDSNEHAPTPGSFASFNGVLQDGRVRNPVPSKLQGRVDGRNGNFSVMHMDFSRPQMTERDLAAKRSSEGTAAAAKLANKDGYRAVKRSQLAWPPRPPKEPTSAPWRILLPPPAHPHPPASTPGPASAPARPLTAPPTAPPTAASTAPPAAPSTTPPTAPPTPHSANPILPSTVPQPTTPLAPSINTTTAPPAAPPFTPGPAPPTSARRALGSTPIPGASPLTGPTPEETKIEQARLLTLLRSLHPVLVVDQICKALAYFGGIPGAPAPADGVFPDSDSTNGPGSLFVGWVAEIFPELDAQGEPIKKQTPLPAFMPVAVPLSAPVLTPVPAPAPVMTSVDTSSSPSGVSLPVKRSRGRPKGSKSSRARKDKGLKKPRLVPLGTTSVDVPDASQSTPANQPPPISQQNHDAPSHQFQSQASVIAQAALREQHDGSFPVSTPGSKKRGRPKGSKNKPKPKPGTNNDPTYTEVLSQSQNPVAGSPLAHKSSANPTEQVQSSFNESTGTTQDTTAPGTTQEGTLSQVPLGDGQVASPETDDDVSQTAQPSQLGIQDNGSTPNAPSRKRKQPQPSQTANQVLESNDVSEPPDSITGQEGSSQIPQAKRRRVSTGLGNVEPQSSATELPASSSISTATAGEPSSASSSFDSQAQMNGLRSSLNQMAQKQHQHQQHQQQQNQQRSPNMALPPAGYTQGSSPVQGRQKLQPPGGQGRPQAAMTAQTLYHQPQQQRQAASQHGQSSNSSQLQHNMMSPPSGQANQPQQQPQRSQPPTGLPNPMGSFQGFGNSNYLDINYPGTSTNTATTAAFGGHTQLEAALAEPNMRENLYHAIGRP